jgi:pyruvate/2-oxoacid:ferredoxin oxidoreductase beta subunit
MCDLWTVLKSEWKDGLLVQGAPKVFPLYEVENGEKWTINIRPKREAPVREYLKLQGRFSHLTEEDIEFVQQNVDREWERLVGRAGARK